MSKRSWIIPLVVLLVAAGLLFTIAGHWMEWEGHRAAQRTDDAYLRADMTPVSTRISGTVRKVYVGDYQSVKARQTLIELDDDDHRANLDQARAALAASEASLEDNQAAKRIQDAQIDAAKAGTVQANAVIEAAKAGIASVSPEADRALTELHRQEALFGSKAATHQQLETATAQQGQIRGSLEARRADLSRSDVELGNALEIAAIQSKAKILQAQQQSLTLKLQGDHLRRQLADLLGLPVSRRFDLDAGTTAQNIAIPSREEAVRLALEQNQDLRAARRSLEKAKAGRSAARDTYVPDLTVISRYSYQSGIPFLVNNFGTFGFSVSYDLFDGGRREAQLREARTEVRSAEVAIDKLQSEIEVEVEAAYDRIEKLRETVDVAGQAVKVRTERIG